jgi:hypothetical protein
MEIFITPQMATGESGRRFYTMMRMETCLIVEKLRIG